MRIEGYPAPTGGFRRFQWDQQISGLQDEIVWQGISAVTRSSAWTQIGLKLFPLLFVSSTFCALQTE